MSITLFKYIANAAFFLLAGGCVTQGSFTIMILGGWERYSYTFKIPGQPVRAHAKLVGKLILYINKN